ncbi:MAG: hypothetical protein D8M52_04475 [Chlorobi bacterium]|nr:hypothetical protein [Chlorobiota bacterium]
MYRHPITRVRGWLQGKEAMILEAVKAFVRLNDIDDYPQAYEYLRGLRTFVRDVVELQTDHRPRVTLKELIAILRKMGVADDSTDFRRFKMCCYMYNDGGL